MIGLVKGGDFAFISSFCLIDSPPLRIHIILKYLSNVLDRAMCLSWHGLCSFEKWKAHRPMSTLCGKGEWIFLFARARLQPFNKRLMRNQPSTDHCQIWMAYFIFDICGMFRLDWRKHGTRRDQKPHWRIDGFRKKFLPLVIRISHQKKENEMEDWPL